MPLAFRPTLPSELEPLTSFLASVFQTGPNASFLEPRLMQWKCFEPVPSWPSSRSYVLKNGNDFLAHGCIYPVTFLASEGQQVTGMRLIDWAGSSKMPGGGVMLWKKLAGLTDTMMGIGGTAQTRALLPKMGFREIGAQNVYARVIRPFRQLSRYASSGWKAPLRLARNVAWSLPRPTAPAGWSARSIPAFDDTMSAAFSKPAKTFVPAQRSAGLLNYFLQCPAARCRAFLLSYNEQVRGYWILNEAGAQARIVDLCVDGGPEDWSAAYALAAGTAAGPSTCEVIAAASAGFLCDILERSGFHLRARMPIFLFDPGDKLAGGPPLHLNFVDGDEFHLQDPAVPTLT